MESIITNFEQASVTQLQNQAAPGIMFPSSHSRRFDAVQQHDPQSIPNSIDDVSLYQLPNKPHFGPSTSYRGHYDDSHAFINQPPGNFAHQAVARPRRSQTTALPWRAPCSLEMLIFVGDVMLTFAPCIFLVLAFQALSVDGKSISSHGITVEQAAKLGPTLFPIIFAAVVGRLMRCYALWRAEQGTSLGILEQLNGSQNLLAALERAVLLPGLGFLSIGVVLLWALSPIGGQSSLRVLGRGTNSVLGNTTLYYTNTTGDGVNGGFSGASALTSYSGAMVAVLQASMASLQLVNGSDIWGNIKIPVLQSIDSFKAGQETDGWYEFNETSYTEPYSALTGIVVSNLQKDKEANFSLESSYYNMSCTDPAFFNTTDVAGPAQWGGFAEWVGNLYNRGTNYTKLFNGLYAGTSSSVTWNSYMIDTNYNSSRKDAAEPKYNYVYASMGASNGWIAAYNCTLGLTYVESQVYCVNRDCHIQRMRPSQRAKPPTSGWPFPSVSVTAPFNMLYWLGKKW